MLRSHPTWIQIRCCENYSIWQPVRNCGDIFVISRHLLNIHRELLRQGYRNILTRTHEELDLLDKLAVDALFTAERPDFVFLAAPGSAASSPTAPIPPTSSATTSFYRPTSSSPAATPVSSACSSLALPASIPGSARSPSWGVPVHRAARTHQPALCAG
jgi:hypothetical protein